jgi:NADH-quinone oxidoreductase subunit M
METLLLLLVLVPFIWAGVHALVPEGNGGKWQHAGAIVGSSVLVVLSSLLLFGQGSIGTTGGFSVPWLPQFGLSFALGQDGVTGTLALLTSVLMVLACVASITTITKRIKLYYSLLFLLIGSVLGVFLSRDLFLFFLFFELELIPMYLLINIWGGPRRDYASMKFVLYTLFGSVFLVAALLGLGFFGQQLGIPLESLFLFDSLKNTAITLQQQAMQSPSLMGLPLLLFLGFFVAFSVKLPVVPVHTWLPDAHVEAPTPVSMLLAGILLKMGAYGLLRFCFEWFPVAGKLLSPYIGLLALINIVYTAGIALVQKDMKKLIAYSSVSHMGFVLLALATLNSSGFGAAVFVMVAHGLVSAALFMGVGTLYRRTHSRLIDDYSGVAQKAPILFYFFLLMSMSSLGLPLLISFAGEAMTFYSGAISTAFQSIPLWPGVTLPLSIQTVTVLAGFGVVLGAAYMLWLVKRVFFGATNALTAKLTDATRSEVLVLGVLTALVVTFGFCPNWLAGWYEPVTNAMGSSYQEMNERLQASMSQQGQLLGQPSSSSSAPTVASMAVAD